MSQEMGPHKNSDDQAPHMRVLLLKNLEFCTYAASWCYPIEIYGNRSGLTITISRYLFNLRMLSPDYSC